MARLEYFDEPKHASKKSLDNQIDLNSMNQQKLSKRELKSEADKTEVPNRAFEQLLSKKEYVNESKNMETHRIFEQKSPKKKSIDEAEKMNSTEGTFEQMEQSLNETSKNF